MIVENVRKVNVLTLLLFGWIHFGHIFCPKVSSSDSPPPPPQWKSTFFLLVLCKCDLLAPCPISPMKHACKESWKLYVTCHAPGHSVLLIRVQIPRKSNYFCVKRTCKFKLLRCTETVHCHLFIFVLFCFVSFLFFVFFICC